VRALHFEGGLFLIAGCLLVLAAALMWQGALRWLGAERDVVGGGRHSTDRRRRRAHVVLVDASRFRSLDPSGLRPRLAMRQSWVYGRRRLRAQIAAVALKAGALPQLVVSCASAAGGSASGGLAIDNVLADGEDCAILSSVEGPRRRRIKTWRGRQGCYPQVIEIPATVVKRALDKA
jgi:hypothetical protein